MIRNGDFMEIRVLRYYLTVVREESITKAAEALQHRCRKVYRAFKMPFKHR